MDYGPGTRRARFVCFHCRKMFRKSLSNLDHNRQPLVEQNLVCAECGANLVSVDRYFEPPRQCDVKHWKQVELQKERSEESSRTVDDQKQPRCAKETKRQQRLQKQQERLASRLRSGRSLSNVPEPTERLRGE